MLDSLFNAAHPSNQGIDPLFEVEGGRRCCIA